MAYRDSMNALGWYIESGPGAPYRSEHFSRLKAFEEFIDHVEGPIGLVVSAWPVGIPKTDDTEMVCSTEAMLRELGRWASDS